LITADEASERITTGSNERVATKEATKGPVVEKAKKQMNVQEAVTPEEPMQIDSAKATSSLYIKAMEVNNSNNNSENSQTLSNYKQWRNKDVELQKSKSDASLNSDVKSNEEMKSNSSNHSKMSIDSIKKDQQDPFDDEESKDKFIPDGIADKDNEYNANSSMFDQSNAPINISTCDNNKLFGLSNKKKAIKSNTKKNKEVTYKQKKGDKDTNYQKMKRDKSYCMNVYKNKKKTRYIKGDRSKTSIELSQSATTK
jgi:hypothetical protein